MVCYNCISTSCPNRGREMGSLIKCGICKMLKVSIVLERLDNVPMVIQP